MDARHLAFEVLKRVEAGGRSDAELGVALARERMSPEDRALATRIVYGVVAWQLRLDHTIAAYADRRIERIDTDTLLALRIGAYQLLLLDRVPGYAAVDRSVGLLSGAARRSAGFANAILRRVARDGAAPLPSDENEADSIELSHPLWLLRLWVRELGRSDANALMRANNEPAPSALRCLAPREAVLADLAARGVRAAPARYAPDALVAEGTAALPGLVVPQSEASQLVTLLLGACVGERVLDACAAPGGKTAYLASLVGPAGSVTAVDPRRSATRRIEALLGLAGVRARVVAARIQDLAVDQPYDAVLVDAPCSGLGTLREHPEIRWRRSEADLTRYAMQQDEILAAASRHVRPGGRLVYATCTLTRAENDDVVDRFLDRNRDFAAHPPATVHPAVLPLIDERCRMRTSPHRHGLAGFFAARLVRCA